MKTCIKEIVSLLESSVAQVTSPLNDIKVVYTGNPYKIPETSYPCLVVTGASENLERAGSRYDRRVKDINIILIYNKRQFYANSVIDEVQSELDAYEKVGSVSNQTTGAYTIIGTIQKNQSLNGKAIDSTVTNVTYNQANGERGFDTVESVVTLQVTTQGDR